MNAYRTKSKLLNGANQAVIASQTNQAISSEFGITASGAKHLVVAIKTASTTVTNAITAKLQTAVQTGGTDSWQDSKTVSITGNGWFFIKLMAETSADQTYLPLLARGRLVITTLAGDVTTVQAVEVLQED